MEVKYLGTIEDIKNLTEEDIYLLSEDIIKRLLTNYISGDKYKNGILDFEINLSETKNSLYDNVSILSWSFPYKNNKYGNYLTFNNNATYLDKKMIINVIFEQIEFTVDCI